MDVTRTGQLIAGARKACGMTQKELADALRVSDRAVSKWERGLNLPNAELFEPLCEILDLSVTELLRGERLDRLEASIEDFQRAVDDAVALVKKKERAARRDRWINAAVWCAVVLCSVLGYFGVQAWIAHDRQADYDAVDAWPTVYLTYYNGIGFLEMNLYEGGYSVPEEEVMLTIQYPAWKKISRTLDMTDGSSQARFYVVGGKSEMSVEILRWPEELRGTGAGMDEAESVPYYGDPGKYHENICIFEIESGYVYSILIHWGDGCFKEYSFATTG